MKIEFLRNLLKTVYQKGFFSPSLSNIDLHIDEILESESFKFDIGDGVTPNKNGDIYPPMSYEVKLPSGDVMHMFDVAPPIIVSSKSENDN